MPERHLEHQTTFSAVKMHLLCVDVPGVFSTILKVMLKNGMSIGVFQTSGVSFDVRRPQCVGLNPMTPTGMRKNSVKIGKASHQLFKFHMRRTDCVGQTIFR